MVLLYRAGGDYWEHLASMYSFARHPFNPPNPYSLADHPLHLFTPFHFFWGLFARMLQLHPFYLLPLIAGINMTLFIVGVQRFAKKILGDSRYALPLALTLLFFWIFPWEWSGFYHFSLLPLTAMYPYWFAFPVSIYILAEFDESIKTPRLLFFSVITACIAMSHPLTGSFLIISLAIKIALMTSISFYRRLLYFILPASLTATAFVFWPFFPIVDTILGSSSFAALGFGGAWQEFYQNVFWRLLSTLPAMPFVVFQLARKRFTLVSLGLPIMCLIYLCNWLFFHNSTLGRYVIYIAFYGHVGIVQMLQHFEAKGNRRKAARFFVAVAICLAASQLVLSSRFIGPFRDLVFDKSLGTYSNIRIFRELLVFAKYVEPGDVVLSPMGTSWQIPAVLGCKVVGVEHSNPFMPDYAERRNATALFFRESGVGAQKKLDILRQYNVAFILAPEELLSSISEIQGELNFVYRDNAYALYEFQLTK